MHLFFRLSSLCAFSWLGGLLVLVMLASVAAAAEDGIVIEEVWIEMPDGTRLATDLYRPADLAEDERVPVLLEYLPYRKTESRSRTYAMYSYFLSRGYIVARVDVRGTGNSEQVNSL